MSNKRFIYIFMSTLFFPMVGYFVPVSNSPQLHDNSHKIVRPGLPATFGQVSGFLQRFQKHFEANYGFRRSMVRSNNLVKVKLLNSSTSHLALLGRDGWIYYGSKAIRSNMGHFELSQRHLNRLLLSYEWKKKFFEERGILYVPVIVPRKASIYKEHYPKIFRSQSNAPIIDQLLSHLKQHSDVRLLDLRSSLLAFRGKLPLFSKSGSFWNMAGACVGSQQILHSISAKFPDIHVPQWDEFEFHQYETSGDDLARMLEMQGHISQNYVDVVHPMFKDLDVQESQGVLTKQEAGSDSVDTLVKRFDVKHRWHRLLVFGDCYSEYLQPFLTPHFSVSHWIQNGIEKGNIQKMLDVAKPDVVIDEINENDIRKEPSIK